MVRLCVICLFIVLLGVVPSRAQDDNKPWERLGLSLTEWKMIQEHEIPMENVTALLKDGIGIGEYLSKPWEKMNMTEEAWIAKRRSGLTNYDIELEATTRTGTWRQEIGSGMRSDVGSMSENAALLSSLALPGYQQLRARQRVKGFTMAGLAVGAISWCVIGSIYDGKFAYIPIGVILVPDMLWSMIDFRRTSEAQGQ